MQTRTLAAVMVTDIAGFSRMMHEDQGRAMADLRQSQDLIAAEVSNHKGQLCESPHDRTVSIFSSAVNAINCASAILASVNEHSDLQVRIGIDVGEVLLTDGQVFGTPVDIASQAERFLDAGGAVLTQSVFDSVSGRISVNMAELGSKPFKGLEQSVALYALQGGPRPNPVVKVLNSLVRRRVPHILGGYLAAGWGAIEVIEWLVDNQFIDRRWVYAVAGALLSLIPSVLLVAFNHGARGPDSSTKQEKVAVPINLIVTLSIFAFIFWRIEPPQEFEPVERASVAVLPFVNLTDDTIGESLGLGIAEELISALAKIRGIYVASRTSSFLFSDKTDPRAIARSLRVATVLEGSIRVVGDEVRVTVQLIDGRDNYHRWTDTFGRQITHVFAVEEDIANAVAVELIGQFEFEPKGVSVNSQGVTSEAYQLYAQGLQALREPSTSDSLTRAEEKFLSAINKSQRYPRAHAALCETYLRRHRLDRAAATIDNANTACLEALRLDDGLRETRLAMGDLKRAQGDYEASEQVFRNELQRNSSSPAWIGLGKTLEQKGEYDGAESAYKKAISLEPGNWETRLALADFLYQRGKYTETLAALDPVLRLSPDNPRAYRLKAASQLFLERLKESLDSINKAIAIAPSRGAYRDLGLTHYYMGDSDKAIQAYEKAVELGPDDHFSWGNLGIAYSVADGKQAASRNALMLAVDLAEDALVRNPNDWSSLACQAWYLILLGHKEEGAEKIKTSTTNGSYDPGVHYLDSLIQAHLGHGDAALDALTRAIDLGWPVMIATHDPYSRLISSHVRFREIVEAKSEKE